MLRRTGAAAPGDAEMLFNVLPKCLQPPHATIFHLRLFIFTICRPCTVSYPTPTFLNYLWHNDCTLNLLSHVLYQDSSISNTSPSYYISLLLLMVTKNSPLTISCHVKFGLAAW
jgi:hypothetical protein